MCLGIPGRILDISSADGLLFATVDFGGVSKRVCLDHVPEARTGDYVLVHVGFALSRLDEREAESLLALLREFADSQDLP